jgi:hypothetical protein
VIAFSHGNTVGCAATLKMPEFLMFLNTWSSFGSSASTKKLDFLSIWYTSPHFSVSPSFSIHSEVSLYVATTTFGSPLVRWPLLEASVPSALLVVFFRGDMFGLARKDEVNAEIKITHNMKLNAT